MNFKNMWRENNEIRKSSQRFYKDYWKEVAVINLVAVGVLVGVPSTIRVLKGKFEERKYRNNFVEES